VTTAMSSKQKPVLRVIVQCLILMASEPVTHNFTNYNLAVNILDNYDIYVLIVHDYFCHTRYQALGPELIPVYMQSANR